MAIIKDIVIGFYTTKGFGIPNFFSVRSPRSHYLNFSTGRHGGVDDKLSGVDDSYKTIDFSVVQAYLDPGFPQPHTHINIVGGVQVDVEPPEALIYQGQDILKVVPPAVVALNLQNVVESVINEVKVKIF